MIEDGLARAPTTDNVVAVRGWLKKHDYDAGRNEWLDWTGPIRILKRIYKKRITI